MADSGIGAAYSREARTACELRGVGRRRKLVGVGDTDTPRAQLNRPIKVGLHGSTSLRRSRAHRRGCDGAPNGRHAAAFRAATTRPRPADAGRRSRATRRRRSHHSTPSTGSPSPASRSRPPPARRSFRRAATPSTPTAAMLAAGCTMWDTLRCGGETQALIYNPKTKKVIGINALRRRADRRDGGILQEQGLQVPAGIRSARRSDTGNHRRSPDDARRVGQAVARGGVRAGDPDGGRLSDRGAAHELIERDKKWIKQWKYSPAILLTHAGEDARSARSRARSSCRRISPRRGASSSRPRSERAQAGKTRKQAIYAAYDRFYKGDIAQELVRGMQEDGGLFTLEDLANWKVRIEEPLHDELQGNRGLQAAACGSRGRRCFRRSTS